MVMNDHQSSQCSSTEAVICTALSAWLPLLFLLSLVDSDGASNHLELPLLPFADHQEPVEGLVPLVDLVALESLTELCVERPVGVEVFCAVSRGDEGVQQQVLKGLMHGQLVYVHWVHIQVPTL